MSQSVRHVVVKSRHPPRRDDEPRAARPALRLVTIALCLGGAAALWPFWEPLVLATWAASIVRPLHQGVARRIHRRRGAAALLTVLLVIAFLTPLVVAVLSLSSAAIELGDRLLQSKSGTEALRSLVADTGGQTLDLRHLNPDGLIDLAQQHGASAISAAKILFGAATFAVVGVVIFVAAFYVFLLEGPRLYEWLLTHSPLARGQFHRLSSTFLEVGHGLLIGVGLTALVQGAVATVGYFALGVPQPLVLGLVTVFASLIPSLGSGLVWGPVSAGLVLAGRPGAAVAMLLIGCVVALVDNVLRPVLAKHGHLRLHGLLIFIAMLGGLAMFGAGGLILGPLFMRLGVEALRMLKESAPSAFPAP